MLEPPAPAPVCPSCLFCCSCCYCAKAPESTALLISVTMLWFTGGTLSNSWSRVLIASSGSAAAPRPSVASLCLATLSSSVLTPSLSLVVSVLCVDAAGAGVVYDYMCVSVFAICSWKHIYIHDRFIHHFTSFSEEIVCPTVTELN